MSHGARFASTVQVTIGTTLGMLVADSIAVFAGSRFAERVPIRLLRGVAAAVFFVFGVVTILFGRLP